VTVVLPPRRNMRRSRADAIGIAVKLPRRMIATVISGDRIAVVGSALTAAVGLGAAGVVHATGSHNRPMARVALELAAIIRHNARQDRHAPGTLVRHTKHGAIQWLSVYYPARPGQRAAPGGYQLSVVTRHGSLTAVDMSSFRQKGPYNVGSKPEAGSGGFEIEIERRSGGRWNATYGGSGEFQCGPPPCKSGGGFFDEVGEFEAPAILSKARQLIAAARNHEPV
jgi:hypothetical protein